MQSCDDSSVGRLISYTQLFHSLFPNEYELQLQKFLTVIQHELIQQIKKIQLLKQFFFKLNAASHTF